jgi:hypothetical protein
VRATLNDELMREAGFESDYHSELVRRRATRLRIARSIASLAVALGTVLGSFGLFKLGHFARGSAITFWLLAAVGSMLASIGVVWLLVLQGADQRGGRRLMDALAGLVGRLRYRLRWADEEHRL